MDMPSQSPPHLSNNSTEIAPCVLPPKWRVILHGLHHVFQPIVNIHSGQTYGIEGFVRGYESFHFDSVEHLLREAGRDRVSQAVTCTLTRMAIEEYAKWTFCHDRKLFINLDARSAKALSTATFDQTRAALGNHGLDEASVIFDITETASFAGALTAFTELKARHHTGFRYAVDDFGTGFSNLNNLHHSPPDFIKIDRSLIVGATKNNRVKTLFSHIVSIAHLFGILVVAEGVETKGEYYTCREAGCDLLQGYIVASPHDHIQDCRRSYAHIGDMSRSDRRQTPNDQRLLQEHIDAVEAVSINTTMIEVFDRFRTEKNRTFFPVIDSSGEPRGIIQEGNFKDYTYSQFGRDLMSNRNYGRTLANFVTPCPVAAISLPAERLLEIYSGASGSEGLIIVDDAFKYIGFLSANALLQVINDKNLALARDQNPLSRLPGNTVIHEFLSECLSTADAEHVIVYFDFDNFKPFNDHYGFRQGDRAIKAFADIMRRIFTHADDFKAHIGGDDFVSGRKNITDFDEYLTLIHKGIQDFSDEVLSYYDEDSRKRGFITINDRYGTERNFPLLTVSAAIICIRPDSIQRNEDQLGTLTAGLKKIAKSAPEHTAIGVLP